MEPLTVELCTCDVGVAAESPAAFAALLCEKVRKAWDSGADLVVFPEYTWLGLERFMTGMKGEERFRSVAKCFWHGLWPEMKKNLVFPGKGVVFGTAPFEERDGLLRNRAVLWCDGEEGWQDKVHMTPWEEGFAGGNALKVFTLRGFRFVVVICLDIEVPELSVALRSRGVDVVLVPSATESVLGVERVGRCASARAVELGCYVGVCHLLGRADSELVDENVGRVGWCCPSQAPFADDAREHGSEVVAEGFLSARFCVDPARLARMRRRLRETNPSLLTARPVLVNDSAGNFSRRTAG